MNVNRTAFSGFIKATASTDHPLQTRLELILTDFEPNGNRQAIPESEADRIVKSALYMPLKINFDGNAYASHHGAIPIGPIVNTHLTEYNGRKVVAGEAIIWNEVYDDVANHLKEAFSEGIGTSWEIYFSESTLDEHGVQWLQGCEFAGTCIVDTPAYGPERTKVLAIAQLLENQMTKIEETNIAESATVDEVRNSLSEATDLLYALWNGLDQMYSTLNEVEVQQTEANLDTIAETFATRIQEVVSGIKSMKDELVSAKSALQAIETEKAQSAQQEKESNRKNRLSELGLAELEDYSFYFNMSDELFDNYVGDIAKVKGSSKAESSKKVDDIPEPLHSTDIQVSDIVTALNEEFKRGR